MHVLTPLVLWIPNLRKPPFKEQKQRAGSQVKEEKKRTLMANTGGELFKI